MREHNEKSYKFAEQMVEILTRVSVCHSHVCEIKNELTSTAQNFWVELLLFFREIYYFLKLIKIS